MLASIFRDKVKQLLTPLGKALGFLNPNHITLFSIVLAVIASYFIYLHLYLYAFVFVVFSSVMDVLDGLVAKTNNKRTLIGNYFDAMMDRLHEFSIMLGFAFSGYALPAFLAFSSSLLVSYAKSRAEMVKSLNNIDWPSIGERVERLLLLFLMLLIRIFTPVLFGFDVIELFLYIIFVITLIGAFQRMLFAFSYLSS